MKFVASKFTCLMLAAIFTTVATSVASASSIQPAEIEVAAEGGTGILTVGTVSGTQCNAGGCQTSTATAAYNGVDAFVSGSGHTHGGSPNSSGSPQ
jgi:hypothetical protein